MVPGSYDQGKKTDAGGHKTDRSGDRTGGCKDSLSSRNPDIDELGKQKARLILLNKADLADPKVTAGWKTYFQDKGYFVVTWIPAIARA